MAGRRNAALTQKKLLAVAQKEFAKRGFNGARTETIATRARVNKGLIHHYFRTKENLFTAVLEDVYGIIRTREQFLDLEHAPPVEGVRRMVEFTFDSWVRTPEFISLLNEENLHRAKHIRKSKKVNRLHAPLVKMLQDLLDRGVKEGVFRRGVDPVQLYLSIAAEVYFYFSNAYTLGVGFGQDLLSPKALAVRRAMICDVILGYLTNKNAPGTGSNTRAGANSSAR